jgi:hypothetical protein
MVLLLKFWRLTITLKSTYCIKAMYTSANLHEFVKQISCKNTKLDDECRFQWNCGKAMGVLATFRHPAGRFLSTAEGLYFHRRTHQAFLALSA